MVMCLSDTVANLVGRKFGKISLFDKTLEGSLSFFIVSVLILSIYNFTSIQIILVSLCATIVELLSAKIKINDNLSIPLVSGFLLHIL